MPIGFTVRELTPRTITVDFDNGGWAVVPLDPNMTKSLITDRIREFSGTQPTFTSVEEIPFTVGETGQVTTIAEDREMRRQAELQRLYTYGEVRQAFYPPLGDQLDALYWARNGDPTRQASLDAEITAVKEDFPKTMEPITGAQLQQLRADRTATNVAGMNVEQLITTLEG